MALMWSAILVVNRKRVKLSTLFGDHIDDSGLRLSIFGVKSTGNYLNFLHRFLVDLGKRAAAIRLPLSQGSHASPIDKPDHLILTAAPNRVSFFASASSREIPFYRNRIEKNAGLQIHSFSYFCCGRFLHVFVAHNLLAGCQVFLNDRAFGNHDNRSAQVDSLLLQLDIDSGGLINADSYIFDFSRTVAHHGDPERIIARRHR